MQDDKSIDGSTPRVYRNSSKEAANVGRNSTKVGLRTEENWDFLRQETWYGWSMGSRGHLKSREQFPLAGAQLSLGLGREKEAQRYLKMSLCISMKGVQKRNKLGCREWTGGGRKMKEEKSGRNLFQCSKSEVFLWGGGKGPALKYMKQVAQPLQTNQVQQQSSVPLHTISDEVISSGGKILIKSKETAP